MTRCSNRSILRGRLSGWHWFLAVAAFLIAGWNAHAAQAQQPRAMHQAEHQQQPLPPERRLQTFELHRLPAAAAPATQDLTRRPQPADRKLEVTTTHPISPPVTVSPANYHQDGENGSHADDESNLSARLDALEKTVDAQADQLGTFVGTGTDAATLEIEGRIHLDHWAFPDTSPGANAMETGEFDEDPQDRFAFRRIRLGFGGSLHETVVYAIQFEFADPNDAEFRDVYLGFEELGCFDTVLLGNQKRPYGLDHLNSSNANVFLERPLMVEAVNQDARRLGVCSYNVSDDLRYNWRYGAYNLRNVQDEGSYLGDHYQAEVAGRFANTLWYDESSDGRGYAHWAVSGTVAHPDGGTSNDNGSLGPDAGENRFRTRPEARSSDRWVDTGFIPGADWYELVGLESVVNLGPLQITGEYINVWMQREQGFGDDLHFHGGYVYASYFLTGEHQAWNRKSGTLSGVQPFENFWLVDTCRDGVQAGMGAWQVAVRGSYADFNSDNVLGGVGKNVTLGLNWWWNSNARMQFNYIYGEIDDREVEVNNTPAVVSGTYSILGTRWMIYY